MAPNLSFLQLPAELREKVYLLTLLHLDVACPVLDDIQHSCTTRGTHATLVANANARLAHHIPWMNLALTCKIIRADLKAIHARSSFLAGVENRTYVLDLDIYNGDPSTTVRKAVWRRMPCSPDLVHTLVINVAAQTGNGPWSEGVSRLSTHPHPSPLTPTNNKHEQGPASLARAIYQLLNHFCHNGPLLHRKTAIPNNIRIRDLIVNIDIGGLMKPPRAGCNVDPRFNYALLLSGFEQISRMGYLFGYVANIHVCGQGEYAQQLFMVDALGVQAVPGAWKNYGFSWGV